ncbi:hypothetical protein EZ313_21380 [Ramlibacter henchirensis]|uniref:Uncharacterized protein n=1 Tax=Ramlibacter henchirensis TaxID=204072 RepID=A0A4Z0BRF1_9BURK|nr:hypothetical protein [Ramlibacter henchirensis]TFZ00980.1 hypothetical protein EZ313_21380 [Ramlibacter henchirensis]
MHFTLSAWDGEDYLLVAASGDAQLCHLCRVADLSARICEAKGYRRALVDLLAVTPHLSFTDHLQLGAHFATALAHLDQVATVVAANQRTGTSEKAAQKHGLKLRTLTELLEAKRWLEASIDVA